MAAAAALVDPRSARALRAASVRRAFAKMSPSAGRPARRTSPAETLRLAHLAAERRKHVDALLQHIKAYRLPAPEEELKFHPTRRWRFDLAWSEFKVAVEVDGLTPQGGGHQRIAGFENDRAKDLAALELGWRVVRVTARQVHKGDAVRAIASTLSQITGVRA